MTKTKISARAWIRTMLFSLLAAFVLQGIFNLEEVKTAFEGSYKKQERQATNIQVAVPDYLRVPEMIAAAAGRLWHWIN